ncbi:UDP-N-acetylmuramoyl-L-alanyl-D-glutamate--2,6-diaminopimelate ligase [Caldimicrobium thiodismutans]|uniref:UDP-N-acetylmuramoyl-L-alanyl-D-glutamate--2,6-diaminopimelate ligase n=1 Tax=Caldimicrobium thiodismutans TaxID=1653476 RepID=A0A0U5AXL8_9BACT|nr:UDP-N-acetylmuramoyl-L-alanyl-D-glutamate--2,6-diaminopimelate ligase [Caldimicrobium thiodismutans]BAU23183.1 UDP-N-acetylmuramoyl-L-alanyl-D-glutamate--2,6-diaminopimelate ligase [Caldimicrobium thiodismutans]
MKRLSEILPMHEVLEVFNFEGDLIVKGITDDSRKVEPGFLFIARRGYTFDGDAFIGDAIRKGAVAILRESPLAKDLPCPQVRVKNIRKALGEIALNFYERPEKELILIGITGTNGKSSTSFFLKSLLERLNQRAGYIGTLFYEIGERIPAKETTPSILEIAPLLKRALLEQLKYVIMETSSHALDQDRIYPLKFQVLAFTNLSRDHLDYHKDIEAYFSAKKKLFTDYSKNGAKAIISLETDYGKVLYNELIKMGYFKREDIFLVNDEGVRVKILERTPGLKLKIETPRGIYEVVTHLFGDYQAKNVATLWGCALALGFKDEEIAHALEGLTNPPGRLELCGKKRGAFIFVDYAHTPDALENALKSLLPFKRGRLITLFGCGGNRDPGKRPLMGKVAGTLSDLVILTSDNPRYEDPLKIIEDIKTGLNGTKPYFCIPDRRSALEVAVKSLREGDILLIAGKGHETYQEIEGKRYPFSDQEEVKKILEELEKNAG